MRQSEIHYPEFREKVKRFNSQSAKYSFCKGIDGGCCIPNVNMVDGDKKVIRDAVARGDIKKWVVRRAQKRAQDPKETQCPFLGDDKRCTIYPQRPISCIQHGNGGLPRNREDSKAIILGSRDTIKARDLAGVFSCGNCTPLADLESEIPREIVLKTMFIRYEVDRRINKTPLNVFVLRELPQR